MFQYKLVSFSKVNSDALPGEGTWYQYEIANHFNRITGYRSGELQEVKNHISTVINYQNKKLQLTAGGYEKQAASFEMDTCI